MKTRLLLLALAAGIVSFAASPEEDLKATIEKWKTAVIKKDKATIEKYTSPDVTYSHSSAKMENRTQMIEAMMSKDTQYNSLDMENTTYRIIGKVALVQTKMTVKNVVSGEARVLPLSVLMAWVNEKGTWQLIARQTTRYQ